MAQGIGLSFSSASADLQSVLSFWIFLTQRAAEGEQKTAKDFSASADLKSLLRMYFCCNTVFSFGTDYKSAPD